MVASLIDLLETWDAPADDSKRQFKIRGKTR